MNTQELINEEKRYIMQTYNRFPVVFTKGKGVKLIGLDGKEYLDFISGIGVNTLGHSFPKIVFAIRNQISKLSHTSNLYYTIPQIKLAKMLGELTGLDKCFFANSGAEANEGAIKLARKYSKENIGQDKYEIITAYNSFHGRTFGALTATGQEKFHKGFEPLLPGFKYVKFNDLDDLRKAISDNTCAVMLEPIQGEGGVSVPAPNYFKEVRKICDEKNLLLILDEIQTGLGRTGKMFAFEHYGIKPDILTLAKGIGGGLPLGVMIAVDKVASNFIYGSHASTFGGGPVVCSAAVAVLNVLRKEKILDNVNEVGKYFLNRLLKLKEKYDFIKDVRGIGLMLGLELNLSGKEIVKKLFEHCILINCTNETVLRFLPPLIITKKDVDKVVNTLDEVLTDENNRIK
ncbi:MAG: aspartate aminotransferase family protein [Candidatus Firestonebacteria bacterium]